VPVTITGLPVCLDQIFMISNLFIYLNYLELNAYAEMNMSQSAVTGALKKGANAEVEADGNGLQNLLHNVLR
jgi:hypothetical protein